MKPEDINRLTSEEIARECRRYMEFGEVLKINRYLDIARAWPLFEATCKARPNWVLRTVQGSCMVSAIDPAPERIIVASGAPGDAIRRAFLHFVFETDRF